MGWVVPVAGVAPEVAAAAYPTRAAYPIKMDSRGWAAYPIKVDSRGRLPTRPTRERSQMMVSRGF